MSTPWNILLVDDEPDVHEVTLMALKRKDWRGRRLKFASAYSGAEARSVIEKSEVPFDMAFIDVVMESNEAGLELCKHIRRTCPRSFRIVLRTGQPGVAPEQFVLNEYDIDHYLAKGDATPERLYNVIRACLRSSEDIATRIAYSNQLEALMECLSSADPAAELVEVLREGVRFIGTKHRTQCGFVPDISRRDQPQTMVWDPEVQLDLARFCEAIPRYAEQSRKALRPHPCTDLGLPGNCFIIAFEEVARRRNETGAGADLPPILGGLYAQFHSDEPSEREADDFFSDARLLIDNWLIAFSALRLQERLALETELRMKQAMEAAVMEKEMEVARAVQTSLLPDTSVVEVGGLRLAGCCRPATHCGGDWWDYHEFEDGKVLVIIGDVTGHGVPAAIVTAAAKGTLTTVLHSNANAPDLAALLHAIHLAIRAAAKGELLMTCFASIYDPQERTITFANAGHNFPYVLDGKVGRLNARGRRLGDIGEDTLSVHQTTLSPGATVLWYTDGITDVQNPEGEDLGERWLRRRVKKLGDVAPDAARDALVDEAMEYSQGTPPPDDITLVVGKVL